MQSCLIAFNIIIVHLAIYLFCYYIFILSTYCAVLELQAAKRRYPTSKVSNVCHEEIAHTKVRSSGYTLL